MLFQSINSLMTYWFTRKGSTEETTFISKRCASVSCCSGSMRSRSRWVYTLNGTVSSKASGALCAMGIITAFMVISCSAPALPLHHRRRCGDEACEWKADDGRRERVVPEPRDGLRRRCVKPAHRRDAFVRRRIIVDYLHFRKPDLTQNALQAFGFSGESNKKWLNSSPSSM